MKSRKAELKDLQPSARELTPEPGIGELTPEQAEAAKGGAFESYLRMEFVTAGKLKGASPGGR